MQKWENYVRGAKIIIFTDHSSLQWMDTSTTGKIQRWALYLQQFDITIRAISGKNNGVADWLSRSTLNPRLEEGEEIDSMSALIYLLSNEETSFIQEQSSHLSPYLPIYDQWVEASKNIPKEDRKYLYQSKEGLWYSIKGK